MNYNAQHTDKQYKFYILSISCLYFGYILSRRVCQIERFIQMTNYTNVTSYHYNPVILMAPSIFSLLFYIFIVLIFAAIHPVWARVDKYTIYGTLKTTTVTTIPPSVKIAMDADEDNVQTAIDKTSDTTEQEDTLQPASLVKFKPRRSTMQNDPRIRFVI